MSPAPEVVVHADAATLAAAVADRLVPRLVEALSEHDEAHLVLTGGTIANQAYEALRASPARGSVDWSRVHLWWGDERFLPTGDPDRNDTQARAALLGALHVPPDHVHPMPPADVVSTPEAAAVSYARTLSDHAPHAGALPRFDVCLLGLGPDAHVASLFPEHPGVYEQEATVVGVHGSPKPPPLRVSLTFPAINSALEVWFIASGSSKAEAVRLMLDAHAGPLQVPGAGVRGQRRTLVLVDRDAASALPPQLDRIASA